MTRMIEGGLVEKLKSGHYQLIIGEDDSGRIPALIMYRIASRFSDDIGSDGSEIVFLDPFEYVYDIKTASDPVLDALKRIIKGKKVDIGSLEHALLVTEHQHTGESSAPLLLALKGLGLDTDVATVSKNKRNDVERTSGASNIYSGVDDPRIRIYGVHYLGGVTGNNKSAHSRRFSSKSEAYLAVLRKLAGYGCR